MERRVDPCVVRPAGPDDLLGVARLIDRTPELGPDDLSGVQQATWRRMLGTEGLTVYVAESDGDVVGTASLLVMPNLGYGCHPTAFVEAMVVAESHRRRGVGRRLVTRVLHDAAAASCRKVQLLSHKRHADDGAHAFYGSLGFRPEAEGFRLYLDDTDELDDNDDPSVPRPGEPGGSAGTSPVSLGGRPGGRGPRI